jgi:uncharacterized membrane protein YhhN
MMALLPVGTPVREIFYALLALWAGLLIVGLALGPADRVRMRRIPLLNRMGSSLILVMCGWLWWWAGTRGTSLAGYGVFVAIGMVFGFLGDLFMAQVVPAPNRVVAGMAAFGVGHVAYIAAYVRLGDALGASDGGVRLTSVAALLAIGLTMWWRFVRSPQASRVLNYGSLAYCLLISAMLGMAIALAVQAPALRLLAIGAALFTLSDVILGNEVVRGNRWYPVGDIVWMTYIVGQALIVFSSASALWALAAQR